MAWLPSHQELRDHPKLRRAAAALQVPRAHLIGHLHCLWWWAQTYAPDGDISVFEDHEIASGAEWEGDPAAFVRALTGCGIGDRRGFITEDRRLHDWQDYAGRWDAKRSAADGSRGNHVRWHENRGVIDPTCGFCRPESGGDIGGRSGGESQIRGEEIRGDKREGRSRKRSIPSTWGPNDQHRAKARTLSIDLDREAERFRDYHQARGTTFTDWDAAFRNWLDNARKFSPQQSEDVLNTLGKLSSGRMA